MLEMMRDLIRHKAWADAGMIAAVRAHEPAAADEEILRTLHHMIVANRFWLSLALARPFDREREGKAPDSLQAVIDLFRETAAEERLWIDAAAAADLERSVETQFLPGSKFSAAQGMLQVCLHSQAHRAQCAKLLRALGATPPGSDFIWWVRERPEPRWPA